MFDFVRKHTRLLQFVLVLLIFPSFVFFGIQGYQGFNESNKSVAKVAGVAITQAEWDNAHRSQVERLRQQAPDLDIKLLDTPEMRQQSLEALVRERVMLVAADKLRLLTTDERLDRLFKTDPQFAFLRNPDGSLKKELLAAQGMSAQQFERQLRQDLAMRQVLIGVGGTSVAPAAATAAAFDALFQQREVRVVRFDSKDYVAKVNPTAAEVESYYKDPLHATDFSAPERASVEYVVLDLAAIKTGINVGEDELKKYYEENQSRYVAPEERRARHILVKVDKSASAADREKAKAKATALLADVRKDPARFAELAKKNSDDPGSAAQGGDLDFVGRGAMVKPFEDALFALKPRQISELVETDFGYHIIELTALRGGEKRPFDAVKGEIEAEIKQQLAQRRYAEAAETFSNTVYEQSDTLQPVADKLKLTVQRATAVTRTPAQGVAGALANPKFLAALFADDTVRNKRNTEAVEIGPNQLAAGRVVEYAAARKLPFDEVKDQVRPRVVAQQAAALARKEGEAKLQAWKTGAAADGLPPPLVISRRETRELPRPVIEAALKAAPAPLPAWAGVDLGNEGYTVVRVDKLLPPDPAAGDAKQRQSQYAQVWSAAETQAYYAALKDRFKVSVDPAAVAASAPR
jgi:peptidyl-prolyl cis-trans isomerase D